MKRLWLFFKRETVLSVAVFLAVLSAFIVLPDKQYLSYIDFRTLGILFCLMTVVASLKAIGLFDSLAQKMLSRVRSITGIIILLVLLCFFFSMIITNDVALITFVPLTIIVMKHLPDEMQKSSIIRTVIMQTIAANLGSMLTPIGNPQNLYLYGKAGLSISGFLRLMLPYTLLSFVLLLLWILAASGRKGKGTLSLQISMDSFSSSATVENPRAREYLCAYFILFAVCLLAVGHILPFTVPLALVLFYSIIRNPGILKQIDYSLLATFAALFIFIGNLGRIPWFCQFLQKILAGHETLTAIAASQVMSNVPAAILLAGFTDHLEALIIGTNLGGLGTLIASMASLISFKYIAKENSSWKGSYFKNFTLANIVFLMILLLFFFLLSA